LHAFRWQHDEFPAFSIDDFRGKGQSNLLHIWYVA
jgi:hypothetical protein